MCHKFVRDYFKIAFCLSPFVVYLTPFELMIKDDIVSRTDAYAHQ
jgi:hypothetical protein